MNPRFPIFIPSKGRAREHITMRYLTSMRIPYRVIVEPQEWDAYASVVDPKQLLVLPPSYYSEFDACVPIAPGDSKGSGPARNFAWDTAALERAEYHWVIDDNIRGFYRCNRNRKSRCLDGTVLRCMEDFVTRYTNVAMAGPHYENFMHKDAKKPP